MKTIDELSIQKVKLNELDQKINKSIKERNDSIKKEFSIFNVLNEHVGDIAVIFLIFVSGISGGIMWLVFMGLTHEYIPKEYNEPVFLGSLIFFVSIVFFPLAYLGHKEDACNNLQYSKYGDIIHDLSKEYKSIQSKYKENLILLDLSSYMKFSHEQLNKMTNIEREVISDLKKLLDQRGDKDIIETINKKNKLNRLTKPVLMNY